MVRLTIKIVRKDLEGQLTKYSVIIDVQLKHARDRMDHKVH